MGSEMESFGRGIELDIKKFPKRNFLFYIGWKFTKPAFQVPHEAHEINFFQLAEQFIRKPEVKYSLRALLRMSARYKPLKLRTPESHIYL